MKEHRGVLILVLGLISFFVFPPLGIAPWLMGKKDLDEMNGGRMDPEGKTLTQIGWILGIIAFVLFLLGVVAAILIFGLFAGAVAGAG